MKGDNFNYVMEKCNNTCLRKCIINHKKGFDVMKAKAFGVILALALSVSMCSCSKNNSLPDISYSDDGSSLITDNIDSSTDGNQSESNIKHVSYKWGMEEDIYDLKYSGQPLQLHVKYDSDSNVDMELGLYVFIDGLPQKYSTAKNSELSYMHKFNFEPEENKVVPIEITPNVGKEGETLSIQFATMLYPSYKTEQNEPYGNNHRLLELIPVTIYFEKDAPTEERNPLDIGNGEILSLESETATRNGITSLTKNYGRAVWLFDNFGVSAVFSDVSGSVDMTYEDVGYENAKYRTTFFVDNCP